MMRSNARYALFRHNAGRYKDRKHVKGHRRIVMMYQHNGGLLSANLWLTSYMKELNSESSNTVLKSRGILEL